MNTMETNVVNEIVLNHIPMYNVYYCFYGIGSHSIGIHNQRVLNRTTVLPLGRGWGEGGLKRATLREKNPKTTMCVYRYIYK